MGAHFDLECNFSNYLALKTKLFQYGQWKLPHFKAAVGDPAPVSSEPVNQPINRLVLLQPNYHLYVMRIWFIAFIAQNAVSPLENSMQIE